jgi:hypothetical protein
MITLIPVLQSIVGIIVICLYWVSVGFVDAILWSTKGANATKYNEHIVLLFGRVLFLLAACMTFNWWTILAGILLFPFFHNGAYYAGRKKIDNSYPNGWWSQPSTGSTAKINYSLKSRVLLAVAGLAVIVYGLVRI